MPLGFKLRKPHMSYDVLSKNLFGVTVELLDNSQLECSLNTDSTGQDCVEHVCQRLGIDEADYFGMKFVNTRLQYQWLDPDQPVKQQLERHAQDPTLYFAVQFYVQSIHQVQDEMARHQIYLQLRHDVVEGKLVAQPGIAIMLAAYMLQASHGDYDAQQQTVDLMRNELLLPNNMMLGGAAGSSNNSEQGLNQQQLLLLRNVAEAHEQLRGMPPALAKLYYIVEAQKLEGYGDESFAAKDASGNDLLLAYNLSGIYIFRIPHSRPFLTMRWHDLKAVGQNKKAIGLECVGSGRASSRMMCVYMEDIESAKYLAKMIELQKEFRAAMAEVEQPQQQQQQSNEQQEQQQRPQQREEKSGVANGNNVSNAISPTRVTHEHSSPSSQQAAQQGAASYQQPQRFNHNPQQQPQQQHFYQHYPSPSGTSAAADTATSASLLNGTDAGRFGGAVGTYTENQQYFVGANLYASRQQQQQQLLHQQQLSVASSIAPPSVHARQQQLQQSSIYSPGNNRADLYANIAAASAANRVDVGAGIYRPTATNTVVSSNQNFQQYYQPDHQQQTQALSAKRNELHNLQEQQRTLQQDARQNDNTAALLYAAHQQSNSKTYQLPTANNSNVAAYSSYNQHTANNNKNEDDGLTYFAAGGNSSAGGKVLHHHRTQPQQQHYSSEPSNQKQNLTPHSTNTNTAASSSSTSTPTPASYVYQNNSNQAVLQQNDESDDPLLRHLTADNVRQNNSTELKKKLSHVASSSSSETNFGGSIDSSSSSTAETGGSSKPKEAEKPNVNGRQKTSTSSPSKADHKSSTTNLHEVTAVSNDPYYYYEDYINNEQQQKQLTSGQKFYAPLSPPFVPANLVEIDAVDNSQPNMFADSSFVVNHVNGNYNNAAASNLKQPRQINSRGFASAAADLKQHVLSSAYKQQHGRANNGGGRINGDSSANYNGHVVVSSGSSSKNIPVDDDDLLWSVADAEQQDQANFDDELNFMPQRAHNASDEQFSSATNQHRPPVQQQGKPKRNEFDDVVDSFYSSQPIATASTTTTTAVVHNPRGEGRLQRPAKSMTPVQSTDQLLVNNGDEQEQFVVMRSTRANKTKQQPAVTRSEAPVQQKPAVIIEKVRPADATAAALPPQTNKKRISKDSLDAVSAAQQKPSIASQTNTSDSVSPPSASISPPVTAEFSGEHEGEDEDETPYPRRSVGPIQLAEMTGLTLSRIRLRDNMGAMPVGGKDKKFDTAITQLLLLDAEHQQSPTATANSSAKRPGSSTLTRSSRRLSSGSPISTYMRRRRQKTASSAVAGKQQQQPAVAPAIGPGRSLSTTRPVSTFVQSSQLSAALQTQNVDVNSKYQTLPSKNKMLLADFSLQRLSPSSSSPVSPLVTVEDRIMRHLKQRLQVTHILSEFAQLPRKRIHKCVCAVAQLPENVRRNAQQLAVPYDDTRIQIGRTNNNSQGYINATDIILSAPSGSAITTITSSTTISPPNSASSSMSINHSATMHAMMTPPSVGGKNQLSSSISGGSQPGITPPYERCYIATQTPLANTVDDFYHMLWRYDVRIVVQLDGRPEYYTDDGSDAAMMLNSNDGVIGKAMQHQQQQKVQHQHPYLPQLYSKKQQRADKLTNYGPFVVKRLSTSHCREGWTTTTLQIECTDANLLSNANVMAQQQQTLLKGSKKKPTDSPRGTTQRSQPSSTRNLVHFSFNAWPNNSMPEVKSFVMFMREVATFYRDASPTQPPLLHCMNGCGRTGVAILFDFASQCLDREILVDLPRVLNHMRIQRPYMVPHARLYRLAFEALKEHYCTDRLI